MRNLHESIDFVVADLYGILLIIYILLWMILMMHEIALLCYNALKYVGDKFSKYLMRHKSNRKIEIKKEKTSNIKLSDNNRVKQKTEVKNPAKC